MSKISEKNLSFVCPMKWDEMAESNNGRFCEQCRREVFDLTDCTIEEVIALQRKHGSICGAVRASAVVATAAAAIGLSGCKTTGSTDSGGGGEASGRMIPFEGGGGGDEHPIVAGEICPPEVLEEQR